VLATDLTLPYPTLLYEEGVLPPSTEAWQQIITNSAVPSDHLLPVIYWYIIDTLLVKLDVKITGKLQRLINCGIHAPF